jgi:AAA domain
MGLLMEVKNEQARAKVGLFGAQGSGKTTTAALLALGVSKTYHNNAPVAMMDTENGSDYLKPIFDVEGVKLFVAKSGAFADMTKVLKEAQEAGCCAFIMDSVTHTWRELVDAYCAKMADKYRQPDYSPQFQDWNYIKKEWAVWTYAFLNAQLHCFVAGRAGNEYEYQINDKGKRELVKGDSKMKAEGEFGYEPSLLIEMDAIRQELTAEHHGGSFKHVAFVLKDRARTLNGKHFDFADMNHYSSGDWKKVWEPFAPFFAALNIDGTQRAMSPATSADMFDDMGDGEAAQRAKSRKIALEEIEALMGTVLWPGATTESKQIKSDVLCALFGVRSWTAVEGMKLVTIEEGLFALQEYQRVTEKPDGRESIVKAVSGCLERVRAFGYIPGQPSAPVAAVATDASASPIVSDANEDLVPEFLPDKTVARFYEPLPLMEGFVRAKIDAVGKLTPSADGKKKFFDVTLGGEVVRCFDSGLHPAFTAEIGQLCTFRTKQDKAKKYGPIFYGITELGRQDMEALKDKGAD